MSKAIDIFDYLFEHYPFDANGFAHFKKLVKRKDENKTNWIASTIT